ncbi:hypothetical protein TNCV_2383891 [Trichonephila clavipes]|nr:hypothetical protein TNCV_2383891 [Trichonephila clavipes]
MSSRAPLTTPPSHGLATTDLELEGLFVEPLKLEILLTKTDVYTYNTVFTIRLSHRAESDLRVSLLDNGLVGPYSDTVLVTSFSPGSSTCASRVRSLNPDLHDNTEVQEC